MTLKKKFFIGLMIINVIIVGFIALFFLWYDFQEYIILSPVEEETVYAKGYSKKAWDKVNLNDAIEKVVQLLGEPLKKLKDDDGTISYFYSDQGPRNKSCRVRIIVFNKKGLVIEKIRDYYID